MRFVDTFFDILQAITFLMGFVLTLLICVYILLAIVAAPVIEEESKAQDLKESDLVHIFLYTALMWAAFFAMPQLNHYCKILLSAALQ